MKTSPADAIRSFCERLTTDKEMRTAMQFADTEAQALQVAKRFGFEFSAEDVRTAVAEFLSEDDLNAIAAAGGGVDYSADPMQYWGTPKWREYWSGYDTRRSGGFGQ